MKIAVAADRGNVSQHFGHCEKFIVFEVENGGIVSEADYPNPGHKPGFLPVYLHEKEIDVIIAGGMGGSAISLFNEKNIEVVVGAQGDARKATEGYLSGELKSTGSVCHEHRNSDNCDDK